MDQEYIKTLSIVTFLSMFGGLVSAILRYRAEGKEMTVKALLLKTFFDLIISAFSGAIAFWSIEYVTGSRELNGLMCAAVAMSGYSGPKLIEIASVAWEAIVKSSIQK